MRKAVSQLFRDLRTTTSLPLNRSTGRATTLQSLPAHRSAVASRVQSRSFSANAFSERLQQRLSAPLRHYNTRPRLARQPARPRRQNYSNNAKTPPPEPPESSLSLTARLKKLSREYGYSAIGVYLALSALDFPFCFLGVRAVGVERIGQAEEVVLSNLWKGIETVYPGARQQWWEWRGKAREDEQGIVRKEDGSLVWATTKGEEEMIEQTKKPESASLGTQLALAYAIHKSFIFIRVPITVAITPKVVKKLRSWGWNIGKRKKSVTKS